MNRNKFLLYSLILIIFLPIQCNKADTFIITLEDQEPPCVLNAYSVFNDEHTHLTFYAEVQDNGSGIAEVILFYCFRKSDDLNQIDDELDWVDVPMSVQITNETTQTTLYTVVMEFPHVKSDYDILYRISTEDKVGNINACAFDIRDYPQRIVEQRFYYHPPGLPEWALVVAGMAVLASFIGSIIYVKYLTKRPIIVVTKKELFN